MTSNFDWIAYKIRILAPANSAYILNNEALAAAWAELPAEELENRVDALMGEVANL